MMQSSRNGGRLHDSATNSGDGAMARRLGREQLNLRLLADASADQGKALGSRRPR